MIAVVILVPVLAFWRSDGKLSSVRSSIILRSGESITLFDKITVLTLFVKKSAMKLSALVSIFENTAHCISRPRSRPRPRSLG